MNSENNQMRLVKSKRNIPASEPDLIPDSYSLDSSSPEVRSTPDSSSSEVGSILDESLPEAECNPDESSPEANSIPAKINTIKLRNILNHHSVLKP